MNHREQFSLSATAETVFDPDQVTVCPSSDAPVSRVLKRLVGFSINSSPSEGANHGRSGWHVGHCHGESHVVDRATVR